MTDPIRYRGGPLDGQVVIMPSGEPVEEHEVKPSVIKSGWDADGGYVWNETDRCYDWHAQLPEKFQ